MAILRLEGLDWREYSYELYQWAATIFGTRSFRASLTLPVEYCELGHIKEDRFSFLLPILDIGNHNGRYSSKSHVSRVVRQFDSKISIG
jgi:hypothetical protein